MGTTYRSDYPTGISLGVGTELSIQTSSVIVVFLTQAHCFRPMLFQLCILIGLIGFVQLVTGVAGFAVTMFRAEKVTYAVSDVHFCQSDSVDEIFQRLDHRCCCSSRLRSDGPFDLLPRLSISSKTPNSRRQSSDIVGVHSDEQGNHRNSGELSEKPIRNE